MREAEWIKKREGTVRRRGGREGDKEEREERGKTRGQGRNEQERQQQRKTEGGYFKKISKRQTKNAI